jgi:hypothetical protein
MHGHHRNEVVHMAWRREDTGYAVAALVATAVVAYFVFANFGLVPSPLTPGRPAGTAIAVPNFGSAAGPSASTTPAKTRIAAPPVPGPVRPPSAVAPTRPAADRTPPRLTISTADGTQVSTSSPASVDGTAADAGSGVARVSVAFTRSAGGGTTAVSGRLHCDASGRSCTWTAKAPSIAGQYAVSATATDRAGNTSPVRTITYTVVDGGDLVTTVTNLVNNVGGVLGL